MLRRPPRIALGALSLALASLMAPSPAQAAPSPNNQIKGKGGNLGLGMTFGAPLGGSLKYFFSAPHAIQANIGWGLLHHGAAEMNLSYLWHPATIAGNSVVDLVPYLGAGIGFSIWGTGRRYYCNGRGCYDYDRGGAAANIHFRLPALGFALHWQQAPLDTVLEGAWVPGIDIYRNVGYFDPHHGDIFLGIRYYF